MTDILDTDVLFHIDAPDDATLEVLLRDFDDESIAEVEAFLGHFSDLDTDEVEDFLAHYGVKGMKWGVRKDRRRAPERLDPSVAKTKTTAKVIEDYNSMTGSQFWGKYGATKRTYAKRVEKHGDPYARAREKHKILTAGQTDNKVRRQIRDKAERKADKAFEKAAKNSETTRQAYNAAADHMNRVGVKKINGKAKYKGKDLNSNPTLKAEYDLEVQQAFTAEVGKVLQSAGTNASGTRQIS